MSKRAGITLRGHRASNVPFLTHPGKPIDRYAAHLSEGPEPTDKFHNSRNLFDDSNKEDGKWLISAREYLLAFKIGSTPTQ